MLVIVADARLFAVGAEIIFDVIAILFSEEILLLVGKEQFLVVVAKSEGGGSASGRELELINDFLD